MYTRAILDVKTSVCCLLIITQINYTLLRDKNQIIFYACALVRFDRAVKFFLDCPPAILYNHFSIFIQG